MAAMHNGAPLGTLRDKERLEFQRRPPRAWREAVLLLVLIGATVAVYWPVHSYPFIVLDDQPYVVHNPHITQLNWETIKWSFTTFRGANWFPLTWLSHALDYHLFFLNAGRHHEINLLLHLLNALVLFWVLLRATGYVGRSWMVAALFALHPINVETVAWIAERKNVLSMLFFLLALGAYHAYARKPRPGSYLVVAALFALGLMCKPQVITLPFVLLLWDYWPLQRLAFRSSTETSTEPFWRTANGVERLPGEQRMSKSESRFLVLEKLPLLLLALGSAILTLKAQSAGGTMNGAVNSFSFAARLGNAILGYVCYLGYAIWPAHLAFFYPHSRIAVWQVAASLVLLIALTWLSLHSRNHRYLAVGWLWFLGTMVPMVGLVQVGSQAMADRYSYLPFIGLFLAVCWGVADWAARWKAARALVPAGALAILLLLGMATRRQVSYWSDDPILWRHTAQITKNNWMAENMIGEDLLREGEKEAAMPHFREAARMEPLFPFPYLHIGIYEEETGHPQEALRELNQVLAITQPFEAYTPAIRSSAFVYMGFAYNQLGDYADREKCMEMAARLQEKP